MDTEDEFHKYLMFELVPPYAMLAIIWLFIAIDALDTFNGSVILSFAGHSFTELPAISFAIVFPLFLGIMKEKGAAKLQLAVVLVLMMSLLTYGFGKYKFLVLEIAGRHISSPALVGLGILTVSLSICAMACSYNCKLRMLRNISAEYTFKK